MAGVEALALPPPQPCYGMASPCFLFPQPLPALHSVLGAGRAKVANIVALLGACLVGRGRVGRLEGQRARRDRVDKAAVFCLGAKGGW